MTVLAQWFSPQPRRDDSAPQSRIHQRLANWLMVAGIILLTVNSARIVYRSIYSEIVFVDEWAYTLSIFNLLSSLTPAGADISGIERYVGGSGIFGSGIGASVFFLGGDLLYSRVTVATLDTLIALFIGFSLFRRWFFSLLQSILGASIFWGLSVTTPFALPYWQGFINNLGELPGALVLALGLLSRTRRPHLAAFFWGLVAWHTKPLYFPVPLLLTLASAWSFPLPIRGKLSKLASLMSIFLLPLFIWLIFAAVRFGITEAANQLTTIFGFIGVYNYSHREFQPLYQLSKIGNPLSLSHLISRLNNLEWSHPYYTFGSKLKVVALSLGSVVITLAGLASQRPADRRAFTTLASCALSVMVLAYTYWWFMLHPTMWIRHFQPAMYIGLGLWVFWLLQISLRFSLFDRPHFRWGAIAFATTFVIWQAYFSWGSSTRISDFPTRWRCPIDSFVLVNPGQATCKKD